MNISKLAILVSLGTALSVKAATTFTSESSFLAALQPGYYHNDFSTLTAFSGPLSSVTASGGTPLVSYQITAPSSGLFINNDSGFNAVGNYAQSQDVVLTFTSPGVRAVGAEFYLCNISGVNQNGTISLTFSDGTTGTAPSSATGPYGFFGVIADVDLTSMTIAHNSAGFLNMANLTVQAVPEPSAGCLSLLGAILLLRSRKR